MHRQDDLWVCTYDAGERVRTKLDRLNARERPFTIKPVPNPKPQNPYYPNTLETDDAAVFNFLAQQVEAQCRYELVVSGGEPWEDFGGGIAAAGWAGRYFYDLIQENTRPRSLIERAKSLLNTIATYLQTRQVGFGITTGATRANNAFYGAFLVAGATSYITQDASTSGLALLYAYRVLGTPAYLTGARAAASYLRNVQAIGSDGEQYTSSDAGGFSRLYTGAVVSEVSTVMGIDPGENFYSNHLFYPSDIIALEFWNELKLTDGDQSIGATTAVNGFDTTPAQLLSTSISDMRSCWETGIVDSTGTLINGLSSTTPREFFNAYPALKTGFTIIGTGLWEFADGNASDGTQITSQNFAIAISSLYNYEGATSQVTTISDWLRSFTSNPDFETPANTSTRDLYRSTTGTYDPTLTIATLLTVRDADNSYAAIKTNGSSLYDWGAFGLLSRLWAARNRASFMLSRLYPLNTVQRYFDGNNTDTATDRITLRGLSGLTLQTGFSIDMNGGDALSAETAGGTGFATTPPTTGLVLWVRGDMGLTPSSDGLRLLSWTNLSTSSNPDLFSAGADGSHGPAVGLDSLDGVPGISFSTTDPGAYYLVQLGLASAELLKDRNGTLFGYGPGETQARTTLFICRPKYAAAIFNIIGGTLCRFGTTPTGGFQDFECLFDLEPLTSPTDFYLFHNNWRNGFLTALQGPPTTGGANGPYTDQPLAVQHMSTGYNNITVRVNGAPVSLTPSVMPVEDPAHPLQDFFVFGAINQGGDVNGQWHGSIFEALIWDHELDTDEQTQADSYVSGSYPSIDIEAQNLAMVNDAVRAAQFGRSFREARA